MHIPMGRGLAYERTASKSCYAEFTRNRQLADIEIQELLISKGGKLATLKPVGSFEIGDKTTRKYRGAGLEISINPVSSDCKGNDEVHEIREKAIFTMPRQCKKGNPVKFNVDFILKCSP